MKAPRSASEQWIGIPWEKEVSGQKVLVVGLGVSGFWSALCLAGKGAGVTVTEDRARDDIDPYFLKTLEDSGVFVESGGHKRESFRKADLIVVSPGVPQNGSNLRSAAEKGIPVIGEMELAARFIPVPIIAVTGTNGKSSVTTWIGQLLVNAGKKVFVGGNLGTPLSAYIARNEEADCIVAEVSSFQLDTTVFFCPQVSLVLNISPDHLDRYSGYEAYIRAKLRIFENQGTGRYAIVNDTDPVLHAAHAPDAVKMLRYGLEKHKDRNAFRDQGGIQMGLDASGLQWFSLERFFLPGDHNVENLMATMLAGAALGIDATVIQNTIDGCKGLPHRLQPAGRKRGVSFYNDSKATNIDAAVRAIESFDGPLILIAGGRHKGAAYSPLVQAAKRNVKYAVFLGESRDLLAAAFKGHIPCALAKDMNEAVAIAASKAVSGDSVLLAPACSSFDMYSGYAHRGDTFNQIVGELVHA